MTILYKLTTQDWLTRKGEVNETKWGPGITHKATGTGTELCSSAVIHAYESPELALFFNRIHANIADPVLWEAEGEIVATDKGRKVGVKRLTTIRIVEGFEVTLIQKIAFGIICAREVWKDKKFIDWAEKWLNGTDRTKESARSVRAYAVYAVYAADAYADAAYAVYAADAADAAAADAYAADAAADAAYARIPLNLITLASLAMTIK